MYTGSIILPEVPTGPSRYEKVINDKWGFILENEFISNLYTRLKNEETYYQKHSFPPGWGSALASEQLHKVGSQLDFQVVQNNKCIVVGLLSDKNWDHHYKSLDYALMCNADATVQIYEKGLAVGPYGIKYSETDTFNFTITQVASRPAVNFIQNGQIVYQSLVKPELPLTVGVALKDKGAAVKAVLISNPT